MGAIERILVDLSDLRAKRELLQRLGALHGLHEITVRRRHRVRSNAQNAWYWACIVPAVQQVLAEQWGEPVTAEDAHEVLKTRFLRVETRVVNETTGQAEPVAFTRSSARLDTAEFTTYCEQCRDWLAEWFGVIVPDPGLFGM